MRSLPLHLHRHLPRGDLLAHGVVVRREERERSRRVLFLLRGHGLIWGTVPLGSRSTLGAATEVMSWGEFRFHCYGRSVALREVSLVDSYVSLRHLPLSIRGAVDVLELVGHLPCFLPQDDLLTLLWGFFCTLKELAPSGPAEARFLGRWLASEGVLPDLSRCCECSSPVGGPTRLSDQGPVCCCPHREVSLEQLRDLGSAVYLPHRRFLEWCRSRFPDGDARALRARWEVIILWMRGLVRANILLTGRETLELSRDSDEA